MRILIAEDEPVSRLVLSTFLKGWGHEVVVAGDGLEARRLLSEEGAPPVAILDWMMPGIDGVEVCRRVRAEAKGPRAYLILLTAKGGKADAVEALEAGADDFLAKPFDRNELKARLHAGLRIVELQRGLANRVRELELALEQVKVLSGLLPICSYCKKIRGGQDYWQSVESYLCEHSDLRFSHGICSQCYDSVVTPQLEKHFDDRPRCEG